MIETARLLFHPLTPDHFDLLKSLHTDPLVMTYLGNGQVRGDDQIRESLRKYLLFHETHPAYGGWAIEDKSTRTLIGCMILRAPATSTPLEGHEIGYSFRPSAWGKGFATEAAMALRDYALRETGGPVVALINPENKASRNVLTKIGFKTIGSDLYVDPSNGQMFPTEILKF